MHIQSGHSSCVRTRIAGELRWFEPNDKSSQLPRRITVPIRPLFRICADRLRISYNWIGCVTTTPHLAIVGHAVLGAFLVRVRIFTSLLPETGSTAQHVSRLDQEYSVVIRTPEIGGIRHREKRRRVNCPVFTTEPSHRACGLRLPEWPYD